MRESNEIEILFGGKNSESLKEVVLHLVGEFILESKKAGGEARGDMMWGVFLL